MLLLQHLQLPQGLHPREVFTVEQESTNLLLRTGVRMQIASYYLHFMRL